MILSGNLASLFNSFNNSFLRAIAPTTAPFRLSSKTRALPIPELAPVTQKRFF
nr:Methyl-accepting chemotaxis protein signaling domain protein [Leptospira interrogans serovar Copenhageni/Icterohaemorrhagiae]